MMVDKKRLKKLIDDYQKRASEAEMNYQMTGSASTYNTLHKYQELRDITLIALQSLDDRCSGCERHTRSIETAQKRWEDYRDADLKDMLSFDHVIDEIKGLKF